jgi:hypothetical protein
MIKDNILIIDKDELTTLEQEYIQEAGVYIEVSNSIFCYLEELEGLGEEDLKPFISKIRKETNDWQFNQDIKILITL